MPIQKFLSEQASPDGVDTGISDSVGSRLQAVRKQHGLSARRANSR